MHTKHYLGNRISKYKSYRNRFYVLRLLYVCCCSWNIERILVVWTDFPIVLLGYILFVCSYFPIVLLFVYSDFPIVLLGNILFVCSNLEQQF